ncbi:MAG: carbohydrate ABC transporter permease [Chloroflexota bacterium]
MASPGGPSVASATAQETTFNRLLANLEKEHVLGPLMLVPAVVLLLAFIGYPFALGIWFSMTDKRIGGEAEQFVGLRNFQYLLTDGVFIQTIKNTMIYTGVTVTLKAILGLALALLMNQAFPFKNIVRASLLLPWIVPTALSTIAWMWIFDPTFSVLNWLLVNVFHMKKIAWLSDAALAMGAIISANVWRGIPFFAISILAGLQTISQELYEASSIDGANAVQRFRHITLPLVQPVLLLVTLFSLVWTIADFQLPYILTRGGPANGTHVFGTLAYQTSVISALLGEGAAISLYMLPLLFVCIAVVLWQINKD